MNKLIVGHYRDEKKEIKENRLRYYIDDNNYFEIELFEDMIRIRGMKPLMIQPEVSNSILIYLESK